MRTAFYPALAVCTLLAGCTVGPNFQKPSVNAPAAFKSAPAVSTTLASGPVGQSSRIEAWWKVFGDARLDGYEAAALDHNPQVAVALANVQAARAELGVSRAGLMPGVTTATQIQAAGETAQQALPIPGGSYRLRGQTYNLPINASYELDLWGRVRRSVESAQASAQASEADLRGVLLSLTTDVARYYFSLRELDLEIRVVGDTARSLRDDVDVQKSRSRAGLIHEQDVQRAIVQAETTAASLADLCRQREQTVHALAVSTGAASSDFAPSVDTSPLPYPPSIPPGVPSQLLERRPDLASAEATLHARTADIGTATAARLPTIALTGSAGFSSLELVSLLGRPSQFWNVGASLTGSLFDGGRLQSQEDKAKAHALQALANYRQSALVAFREVDDALVALRHQRDQGTAQDAAEQAAEATASIAKKRYEKGLTTYLDVTDAERTLLQIQQAQAQLTGARYASTVSLIKALGGAWQ